MPVHPAGAGDVSDAHESPAMLQADQGGVLVSGWRDVTADHASAHFVIFDEDHQCQERLPEQ
jgi:hypothetical protein